jgi:hypothetical protein
MLVSVVTIESRQLLTTTLEKLLHSLLPAIGEKLVSLIEDSEPGT